jgi:hypothetical protein
MVTCGLSVCAACGSHDIVVGGFPDTTLLRAAPNRDLDLLFVIDSSAPAAADTWTHVRCQRAG